jgi:hypothetical protein
MGSFKILLVGRQEMADECRILQQHDVCCTLYCSVQALALQQQETKEAILASYCAANWLFYILLSMICESEALEGG